MLKDVPVAEPAAGPDPHTAEIFSQDQLEAYSERIAVTHRLADNPRRGRPLLPRLDQSASRLEEAYRFLSAAARTDPHPVSSEDWLRDNHHVVQDQVREIRQDLPRNYYLELPKLADGRFQGYPRVYLLARELIAHTAGRIDLETLVDFVNAYQRKAELSIGEIWAIPIMLRLALVEELRRLADGVVAARRSREKARRWHERLVSGADWTEANIRRLLEEGPAGRQPALGRVRRGAAAMAARPALDDGARVAGAAGRAAGSGRLGRRDAADRASARGRGSARDRQRDHEHAPRVVDRLDAVLRAGQPRRAALAGRPGGRVRADGLLHARSLPPLDRGALQARTADRDRRGQPGDRAGEDRASRRALPRPPASCRLLPDLPRPLSPGAGPRLPAETARAVRALRVPPPGRWLPGRDRRGDVR